VSLCSRCSGMVSSRCPAARGYNFPHFTARRRSESHHPGQNHAKQEETKLISFYLCTYDVRVLLLDGRTIQIKALLPSQARCRGCRPKCTPSLAQHEVYTALSHHAYHLDVNMWCLSLQIQYILYSPCNTAPEQDLRDCSSIDSLPGTISLSP
jgi:hypothetical protein